MKKRRDWKSYHEKILNTEFAWNSRNSLSQADIITSIPWSVDKDKVRESISKTKNGKAAELSGVVSEMVKTVGKAGVEMIADIVFQVIVDRRSAGNNDKVI